MLKLLNLNKMNSYKLALGQLVNF